MPPTLGAGQMVIDIVLNAIDWNGGRPCGWVMSWPTIVALRINGLRNTSSAVRVSMDASYQPLSEPNGEKYLGDSQQHITGKSCTQAGRAITSSVTGMISTSMECLCYLVRPSGRAGHCDGGSE